MDSAIPGSVVREEERQRKKHLSRKEISIALNPSGYSRIAVRAPAHYSTAKAPIGLAGRGFCSFSINPHCNPHIHRDPVGFFRPMGASSGPPKFEGVSHIFKGSTDGEHFRRAKTESKIGAPTGAGHNEET